jgi:hypothetical protein
MKKYVLLYILAILLLLVGISGCRSGSSGYSSSGVSYDDDYHSGYDGITMEFVNGNPPYRLYAPSSGSYGPQTDSFNIMVEVQNEGAYDVSNYKFVLSGFDSNIVDLADPWRKENLDSMSQGGDGLFSGRGADNPIGDIDTVTWQVNTMSLPDGIDRFDQRFMVSTCYDYQTTAAIPICVDPRPWRTEVKERVCTPGDMSLSGGQGAPVAVSHVEVIPMNDKVQLKVEIRNAGNGEVLSWGGSGSPAYLWNSCPHDLEYIDLNRVWVENPVLGGRSCVPTPNPVILNNGRGYFHCTVDLFTQEGREDAYISSLNIILKYGYTESIYTDVDVTAIPG